MRVAVYLLSVRTTYVGKFPNAKDSNEFDHRLDAARCAFAPMPVHPTREVGPEDGFFELTPKPGSPLTQLTFTAQPRRRWGQEENEVASDPMHCWCCGCSMSKWPHFHSAHCENLPL